MHRARVYLVRAIQRAWGCVGRAMHRPRVCLARVNHGRGMGLARDPARLLRGSGGGRQWGSAAREGNEVLGRGV